MSDFSASAASAVETVGVCGIVPRSVDVVELLAGPSGLLSEYDGGFTY